jgi:hypothetical protein
MSYEETRQTGSHVRLTTQMHGVHHVTVKVEDTGADRPRRKLIDKGEARQSWQAC